MTTENDLIHDLQINPAWRVQVMDFDDAKHIVLRIAASRAPEVNYLIPRNQIMVMINALETALDLTSRLAAKL